MAVVDSYCDYESGMCWASNATLAARLKLSGRQVSKLVSRLVDIGFLVRGPDIVHRSGNYRTVWTKWSRAGGWNLSSRGVWNQGSSPPRNLSSTNKNTDCITNKGEAVAANAADRGPPEVDTTCQEEAPVDLTTILKSALDTTRKRKKTDPTKFDKEIADFIRGFARDQGWRISTSRKVWADSVRLLREDVNGPTPETISTVLAGYVTAVKAGKTTFKVRHCKDLRDHWEIVQKVAAKSPPPASDRAKQIADKSALEVKWPPAADPAQVAALAQKCITFAEVTADRAKKLADRLRVKKPKTAADRSMEFALTCAVVYGGPDGFALSYLKKVRDEVRAWKGWGGDLAQYAPTLGSKHAGVKKAVLASCSPATWELLKKELS